jgi:DNA polymerase-1
MGWSITLDGNPNARALANWPTQTNGAEIMRLAIILATEGGIKVCCPVHDALLIESPIETLDGDIKKTQQFMQQAGEIILDGFKLRTDVDRVVYPDRYMDGRGLKMWDKIMNLIEGSELE